MSGIDSAEQRIVPSTVQSGDSVEVNVTVTLSDETDDLRVIQRFGSSLPADVSVLRADGATLAETTDERDLLVGSWGGVTGIELAYSVRVPDDATGGDEIVVSGTVEDRRAGDVVTPAGETTIRVVQPEDGHHESGVPQELFDAVDRDGSGTLNRGDVRRAINQYARSGEVDGVPVERDDLRGLINYYARQ